MEQDEIWKPVKGFEGYYEINRLGCIRSVGRYVNGGNNKRYLKPRNKKPTLNSYGYYRVLLHKGNKAKTVYIHRALMEAFVPNPSNKPCVDHINTIRTDNRLENLRWVTYSENTNNPLTIEHIKVSCSTEESVKKGLKKRIEKGCRNIPKQVFQYTLDWQFVKKYTSIKQAAKSCCGFDTNICKVIDKKHLSSYGFHWLSKQL